jgi:hypothetical protein
MVNATGSRHSAYYDAETVYGTTDATPAWTPIRNTGVTLGLDKETITSEEIRDDRQIVDFRHGNKNVNGDTNTELSYGSFDDFLEAALGGTWAVDTPGVGTDQLKVGTTRRSFSIMREFANVSVFHVHTGCEVNTFNLNVTPNAIVTSTFNFMGKDVTSGETAGSTYNSPTTTEPFDSFSGTITEGGGAIAVVTALTLTLENGLEAAYVIGSDTTTRPTIGRSNLTGSIDVFFESQTLLDKFWNETESSLQFTLVDPAGNTYDFTVPRIKYTGGKPDVAGEGAITVTMPFQAMYDSTEGSNLTIERTDI